MTSHQYQRPCQIIRLKLFSFSISYLPHNTLRTLSETEGNLSHSMRKNISTYGKNLILMYECRIIHESAASIYQPPTRCARWRHGDTEGGFFFLIGRRRSGKPGTRPKGGTPSEARRKKLSPSGKPCPLGGLMVFICRHLPANDHFHAISVPQVSETNGW